MITLTSKQCPNCRSWLQKLDGCNKMTCSKCQCYFCWLCLSKLSKIDPYSHFNLRTSECFEKLFEGVENEDGEPNRMLEVNLDDNEQEDQDDRDDDLEPEDDVNQEDVEDHHVDEQFALRLQLEELDAV